MAGTHTTIETLSHKLLQRWVPKWYEAFCDQELGGFYERLGHSFKPIMTGQRRLLTQCRQLATYSHAQVQGLGRDLPDLEKRFLFIVDTYHIPKTGGWLFSVDDEGAPLDKTQDLYALAFVIFGFAHYFRATGDERAKELALTTLQYIDSHFRISGQPGLTEALDEKGVPVKTLRRHESHMHLLEACLFATDLFADASYRRMCDELVDLFRNYFYQQDQNLLSEYYTDDLKPAVAANGHVILEPGHYCEWIWLLKKHAVLCSDPARYDALCKPMLEWASTKGWDDEYGGIYDELNPENEVVANTKRLWPFAEALKANALMLDSGVDKDAVKARINKMVKVFRAHYMEERGFWTEWLKRDLTQETDYMPATTPYHVYFGIMETRDVIQARGKTRSLVAGPVLAFYGVRRKLSDVVRALRFWFKAVRGVN